MLSCNIPHHRVHYLHSTLACNLVSNPDSETFSSITFDTLQHLKLSQHQQQKPPLHPQHLQHLKLPTQPQHQKGLTAHGSYPRQRVDDRP